MSGRPCLKCKFSIGAKARAGLCAGCWQDSQPDTVDGATIKQLREHLDVSINLAAAAIGLDPKKYVDDIEFNLQLDADAAAMIRCAIEALHDEQRPLTPRERTRPPSASLAIDGIS